MNSLGVSQPKTYIINQSEVIKGDIKSTRLIWLHAVKYFCYMQTTPDRPAERVVGNNSGMYIFGPPAGKKATCKWALFHTRAPVFEPRADYHDVCLFRYMVTEGSSTFQLTSSLACCRPWDCNHTITHTSLFVIENHV